MICSRVAGLKPSRTSIRNRPSMISPNAAPSEKYFPERDDKPPDKQFQAYHFNSLLESFQNLVHEYIGMVDLSDNMRFVMIYEIE
jgi:hypothetical protein